MKAGLSPIALLAVLLAIPSSRAVQPGDLDLTFDPGSGPDNIVRAIAIQPDGKIIIGGAFTSVQGVPCGHIARLNEDGSLDTSFNPGTGTSGDVYAIVLQPDGKILIGGTFSRINGISRTSIARLNEDGSLDENFVPYIPNGRTYALVLQPDGKILFGREYSFSVQNPIVGRMNADGQRDVAFNSPGFNSFFGPSMIYNIARQPDGRIVVAGRWDVTSGSPNMPTGIASLNSDGSFNTNFSGITNFGIYYVASQPDGKILLGGSFPSTNQNDRFAGIVRLYADGPYDDGFYRTVGAIWKEPIPPPWFDLSSTLQPDGKILVGGLFGAYNGVTCSNLVRLNVDGSVDTSFFPKIEPTSFAVFQAMAVQPDGKVIIAGHFSGANGVPRPGLARLIGNNLSPVADAGATEPVVISPNGISADVILDGSQSHDPDGDPLQYTWYEEGMADPLAGGEAAAVTLSVGTHPLLLAVTDGIDSSTNAFTVEVITTAEAVEGLMDFVNGEIHRPQPLRATLAAALASIQRRNPVAAIRQLQAFEQQVRAQLGRNDPDLTDVLVGAAEDIIEALENSATPARHIHHRSALRHFRHFRGYR